VIPHITNEIKHWIRDAAKSYDVCIVEIGGTIGDIENSYFVEACRQLKRESKVFWTHLTLVPVVGVVGEQKSKPTQHSVKTLLEAGVQPDMIVARSEKVLDDKVRTKISLFCNVPRDAVISDPDQKFLYELPFHLKKQRVVEYITKEMGLKLKGQDLKGWVKLVHNLNNPKKTVKIAICGKYTGLKDSYISILESLKHCDAHLGCKSELVWLETTDFNPKILDGIDGIIVPGGFGSRGVEGKIKAIQYARENNIPFLGLCYGLQLAVVEFARTVCGMKGANTTEVNPRTTYPVIDILPEQKKVSKKGGTMRLGGYPAILKKGTIVRRLYGKDRISERHRHRYEVNPKYIQKLESKGLVFSGRSPDRRLMEFVELPDHKYFVATQAHPEFKSRFEKPAPLFLGFVKACLG
jgi:CTP synthase